jgi:hypothetical protein
VQAIARLRPARVTVNGYGLALAGLAGLGMLLRFYRLGDHYLSYDECFTWLMTTRSLPDMIRAAAGDVHPPLSYLMYWLFVRLAGSTTNLTLRLPESVIGSLSIWQAYALGQHLKLGRLTLMVGLALFCLSPFEIHYSQDARMYGLLQLAVLGAIIAMFDRRYWLMGVWLAVGLWSHNYGLFYIAVIGGAAWVREMQRPALAAADSALGYTGPVDASRARQVVVACGLAVASWLPWAGVLVWQMRSLSSGYWIEPMSLAQGISPLFELFWGVALPTELNAVGAAVAIGLAMFACVKALRLRRQRLLLWLILMPALLAAVVSLVSTPIYLFRAFVGVEAPLLMLIAWAIVEGTCWRERLWALAIIAPLLMLAIANRLPALELATDENSWALKTVLAEWQPGDVVYHGNVGTLSGFLASGPAWLPNYLMTVQPGSVGVLTPETRRGLGFCEGSIQPGELVTSCGSVSWRRVWLVWGASQTISGAEDAAVAAILARYPNVKKLDIHDTYHGPWPVDGGIWLLTNGVNQ